jgi:hypothetical protein
MRELLDCHSVAKCREKAIGNCLERSPERCFLGSLGVVWTGARKLFLVDLRICRAGLAEIEEALQRNWA